MLRLLRLLCVGGLLMVTAGCEARERCLAPPSILIMPDREAVIAGASNGSAGQAIMEAAWAGDRATMARLLAENPRLAATASPGKEGADLLMVALLHCDREMLDLLLAAGAPPDGSGESWPMVYAIGAPRQDLVEPLLKAGASPHADAERRADPMRMAILFNRPDVIRLLLAHGADVNAFSVTGDTALLSALSMESFDLAELLINEGANIWAITGNGGTIGHALTRPAVKPNPAQEAIRARLIERLKAEGFPWPPPTPQEGRRLLEARAWPPPGARNAPPVPPAVLAQADRHLKFRRENPTHFLEP